MTANKTIKFFISSTFKDFLHERNVLQHYVFPRLRKYCEKEGFYFQPVDLRWGVTEESSDDNQTMAYCLNEVSRCSVEPKPNLLILLGQRYGWGPLPSEISQTDYTDYIEPKLSKQGKKLFDKWYKIDNNADPVEYYLIAKKEFGTEEWSKDEHRLKTILRGAVNKLEGFNHFYQSATELEIRDSIDKYHGDGMNTLVYHRQFQEGTQDREYIEEEATKALEELADYITGAVGNKNILRGNDVDLDEYKQINSQFVLVNNDITEEKKAIHDKEMFAALPGVLKCFAVQVYKSFRRKIRTEINDYNQQHSNELGVELVEQKNFLEVKSKDVIGRKDETDKIKEFINSQDGPQHYLLYGSSGSGKTSVMAKAIEEAKTLDKVQIYYRFIGTTAHTTYGRDMLEYLLWQIEDPNKKFEQKPNYPTDEQEFNKHFSEILSGIATEEKPVIVFLDALDQLQDYIDLQVFLEELPKNVKVVFSTLYDESRKDAWYASYFKRIKHIGIAPQPLKNLTNNCKLLYRWLSSVGRKLSKDQRIVIYELLDGKTPLYTKLLFEIVKNWKSGELHWESKQPIEQSIINLDEKGLINFFFESIQKKYHHTSELNELFLSFLSATKEGLSEQELIDLFSYEPELLKRYEREDSDYPKLEKLPTSIFSRYYFHIQQFFTEKLIDNEKLITFYHRIIEESIKEKFRKNLISARQKIINYFLSLKIDSLRKADELAFQLRQLEDRERMIKYIFTNTTILDILIDTRREELLEYAYFINSDSSYCIEDELYNIYTSSTWFTNVFELDKRPNRISLATPQSSTKIFATLNSIGTFLRQLQAYEYAERFFKFIFSLVEQKTISISKITMGALYNNLAVTYRQQPDKDEKALEMYLEVEKLSDSKIPNESLLTARFNLASFYYNKEDYDLAIDKYVELIDDYESLFGKSDLRTARLYNALATAYFMNGDNDKNIKFIDKALMIQKTILGENNYTTLNTNYNKGMFYRRNRPIKAIETYKKALKDAENMAANPVIAKLHEGIGLAYIAVNDYKEGLENIKKSIEIYIDIYGENDKRTIKQISLLQMIEKRGKLDDQESLLTLNEYKEKLNRITDISQMEKIAQKIILFEPECNEHNDLMVKAYNILGVTTKRKGEKKQSEGFEREAEIAYKQAEVYYSKALQMQIENFGENSFEVAMFLQNIGDLYMKLPERYQDALLSFSSEIQILEKIDYDNKDYLLAKGYHKLGYANLKLENYEQAIFAYEKARTLYEESEKENQKIYIETIETMEEQGIAEIYSGNLKEGIVSFIIVLVFYEKHGLEGIEQKQRTFLNLLSQQNDHIKVFEALTSGIQENKLVGNLLNEQHPNTTRFITNFLIELSKILEKD